MFLSCDPQELEFRKIREKALKDKTSALETAEARGVEKGLHNAIRNLSKNGFSKEFILENLNCTAEIYAKALESEGE